jgi:hypothetical protein
MARAAVTFKWAPENGLLVPVLPQIAATASGRPVYRGDVEVGEITSAHLETGRGQAVVFVIQLGSDVIVDLDSHGKLHALRIASPLVGIAS